jgi:hypothetical protein
VKDVINAALAASNTASQLAMKNAAKTLTIPGLPAQGQTPPAFTGFSAAASALSASILAANPCQTTAVFTCKSGSITAVVSGRRQVLTLTYPSPLPTFVPHIEDNTVDAVNCALRKATDRPDDTTGTVDKITGSSATFTGLCLYASNSLDIELGVTIRDAIGTGYAQVANAGTFFTHVETNSHVGNVYSRADVTLFLHANVHGFIRTAGTVSGLSLATVTGPVTRNAVLVLPDLTLKPAFPSSNLGLFVAHGGQQRTITPGYYTKIESELNGTITFNAGVYYCNDFDLDPGGKVIINGTNGPVILYVKNTFDFDGTLVDSAGGFPNLLVGYVGLLPVFLNKPFNGTFVAPNAKINMKAVSAPGHNGAFHAKDIEVDSNTVQHHPFGIAYESLPGLAP